MRKGQRRFINIHTCGQENKCFNCIWFNHSGNDEQYWDKLICRLQGCKPAEDCGLLLPHCPHGEDFGHGPIPPEPVFQASNDEYGYVKILSCDQWRKEFIDYQDYLNNWLWEERKAFLLKNSGYRCELCGSGKNLTVHHITYDRIGAEKDSDLLVVCRNCHRQIHETDIERSGTNGR